MLKSISILLISVVCVCALFSAYVGNVTADTNNSPASSSVTNTPSSVQQPQVDKWL